MQKQQAMKIEVPWVKMGRIAACAAEPVLISADGIERATCIGEEGGEQQNGNDKQDTEAGGQMPKIEAFGLHGQAAGVDQTIPKLVQSQSKSGAGQSDDERFFSCSHEAKSSTAERGPT